MIHAIKELKSNKDNNTVVVGKVNTLLSPIDRSSTLKNQQRNPRIK
jgi:hypothetical protein